MPDILLAAGSHITTIETAPFVGLWATPFLLPGIYIESDKRAPIGRKRTAGTYLQRLRT